MSTCTHLYLPLSQGLQVGCCYFSSANYGVVHYITKICIRMQCQYIPHTYIFLVHGLNIMIKRGVLNSMMKCAVCVEEEFYKLHTTIMIPRTRLLKVEKRQLVTISSIILCFTVYIQLLCGVHFMPVSFQMMGDFYEGLIHIIQV